MLYRLISLLLFPLWCLHGWQHGKKRGVHNYLELRLARKLPEANGELLWFHASSVGEVESITPLARHYLDSKSRLLMTSFTASGLETIRKNFGDSVISSVIPIDARGPCQRFFDHFPVRHGIIMETELWPELLKTANQRNIPLVLANARLSEKSTTNPLAKNLLGRTVGYFSAILCRNLADQQHFLELGAEQRKIEILGNLKAISTQPVNHPRLVTPPYLLLASSHDPEEVEFLHERPRDKPLPLLVIAPRHPERSQLLQSQLQKLEVKYCVRSKRQIPGPDTEVYLADTLGELTAFMQHATVVIMGGSFEGTGGHNLHEPARLGCAIITGPSDSNIREDIDWLEPGKGILQVTSLRQAWQATMAMLETPTTARTLGAYARQRTSAKTELLSQYIRAIDNVISEPVSQA